MCCSEEMCVSTREREIEIFGCVLGKFTRRGSTDMAADAESLSAKHSHSHHSLLRDMPDHSNSHSDNTVKEGKSRLNTHSTLEYNSLLSRRVHITEHIIFILHITSSTKDNTVKENTSGQASFSLEAECRKTK